MRKKKNKKTTKDLKITRKRLKNEAPEGQYFG